MPAWLIIADDLTGANDTGVCFARCGLKTLSALTAGQMLAADVWVVSTASRHLPPGEAAGKVESAIRQTLGQLDGGKGPRVYKKMDSALRGNPAVELLAVLQATNARRALVTPALPAQGRAILAGRAFWRGIPLEQTEFGSQIATADLAELFAPLKEWYPLRRIDLEIIRLGAAKVARDLLSRERGVWIADAETDADLESLALAADEAGVEVLCGSAGLANAAARTHFNENPAALATAARLLPGQPVLVVAGSRSQAAIRQVEYACQHGMALAQPPEEFLVSGDTAGLSDWAYETARRDHADLLLTTAQQPLYPSGSQWVAERLALAAVRLAEQIHPAGMVLTGGDTAAAVFAALNCCLAWLEGEVEPGVAWGWMSGGDLPGLAVVTKAGSFGGERSLVQAVRFLKS
jgi:D-threonate/D-erythronate kinase